MCTKPFYKILYENASMNIQNYYSSIHFIENNIKIFGSTYIIRAYIPAVKFSEYNINFAINQIGFKMLGLGY